MAKTNCGTGQGFIQLMLAMKTSHKVSHMHILQLHLNVFMGACAKGMVFLIVMTSCVLR